MQTKNLVQFRGYVARDIQSKHRPNGHRVALGIATPEVADDSDAEPTACISWHDVVALDELAEQVLAEFVKGSQIEVEGRLAYRGYDRLTIQPIQKAPY